MPDELRVGVIGTGRMGTFHIGAWQRLQEARLTAVADPDEAARKRAINGGSGVTEHDDWRRLIDRAGELDAVTLACPSEMHAEVAQAALEAGLHVLVEKPIATSLPDALRLRGAAREAGRKLMVGHVERFNPVVDALRQLLALDRIGQVFRAQAVRVSPMPARIKDAGVGIDLATHDIDVMQFVLGRQVSEIYADGGRFVHPSREDLLTCLTRFREAADEPEVLGLMDVNWLTPEPRREFTLIGERGLMRASYITQEITVVDNPGPGGERPGPERLTLEKREPLLQELRAFARCVLDDTPEPVSAHDGVCALAVALAVRESASVRRPVTLLEIPAPTERRLEAVA